MEHFWGSGTDEAFVTQLHKRGPGGLAGHVIMEIFGLMAPC